MGERFSSKLAHARRDAEVRGRCVHHVAGHVGRMVWGREYGGLVSWCGVCQLSRRFSLGRDGSVLAGGSGSYVVKL
jgi:hypothetical protein